MPNEPRHAKETRLQTPERQNAQGEHEGSAHISDEFDVMNPQKPGIGKKIGSPRNLGSIANVIARTGIKDCVIVGGGPAGLTAALYLARFLRSVTVFDAQDGRARLIPKTHNLAHFPDGISGFDLLDRMRVHAQLYGATVEPSTVKKVEKLGDVFQITTDSRTQAARTVIFAMGVFNHRPPLSPESHAQGLANGLIRYCPVCDAYEIRNRRIAVLGNGNHGAKEARFLVPYSPWVTLIPSDGSVGVPERGIAALDAPMARVSLSDCEVTITLQTGASHRFDTLYVALGTTARTAIQVGPDMDVSSSGHVVVNAKHRTSIDGAYAIGDVTDGLDQIAVAMGQGAIAATAIHNSLPVPSRRRPGIRCAIVSTGAEIGLQTAHCIS